LSALEELSQLMKSSLQLMRPRLELFCGEGVAEALAEIIPERAAERDDFYVGAIGDLTGMPIIKSPDLVPGKWELVRHDGCRVEESGVSHAACSVTRGQLERR